MQIERNEIRCFHAVVEAGGFSRAAERLDLSQSAVSQAIANLEHRLGAVLLRRGNPPQLTEAGIRLLRFAETVMNEERETLADIAQIKSGALSTLSLALSPAANARFGIALLREFSERNPLTRFNYLAIGGGGVTVQIRPGIHLLGGLRFVHRDDGIEKAPRLVHGDGQPADMSVREIALEGGGDDARNRQGGKQQGVSSQRFAVGRQHPAAVPVDLGTEGSQLGRER